jgi:Skp family chaperone for outer membrane proteins
VKAIEATKKVAEDKGIDLVVPKSGLLFHDEELEITDSVIAVLNSGE